MVKREHNKTKKIKKTSTHINTSQNAIQNNNPNVNDAVSVYSLDDYNSGDGMLTSVWGPSMWHYLHTMSFNYPVQPTDADKKHYYEFIENLQYVLPCGKCRRNLCKNFKKLPLTIASMESRHTFSKYLYDLHEVINKMLGKKSGLTYEEIRERYEHFRSRCAKSYTEFEKRRKTNKHVHFAKKVDMIGEKGCTEPLYGEKSKCVLQIVPQKTKCESFQMDKTCKKIRYRELTPLPK